MKIQVLEGQPLVTSSTHVRTIVGAIPVKHLADRAEIPEYDALRDKGYQRAPKAARINKLAREIEAQKVDIAPSILMNIRGDDAGKYLVEEDGNLYLEVPLDSKIKFFIVDGQHRVRALTQLYENGLDAIETWGEFKLQFVCMIGAAIHEEMTQFYVVNSEAKSVPTALAHALLAKISAESQDKADELISKSQDWKVTGHRIAERLSKEGGVWKGKIRLANQPVAQTVLPVASLISSLRPLHKDLFFGQLSIDDRVSVLVAYWEGVKEALPEAFGENYSDFSIQKGLGASVLNELLLSILDRLRYKKNPRLKDKATYVPIMKKVLHNLSGQNAEGETVEAENFWRTAKAGGAAGAFSSSAGKKVLLAKLVNGLPPRELN